MWRLIEGRAAVGRCLQELHKHTGTNAFLTGCKRSSLPRRIHPEKNCRRLEAIEFISIAFSLIKETKLLETALPITALELPLTSLGLRCLDFYFLSLTPLDSLNNSEIFMMSFLVG